jgi:hypothetical protein
MRMLAPSGEDATVRFPVEEGTTEVPVVAAIIVVAFDTVAFVVICSGVAFVGITVVMLFTGYIVAVVRLVSVSVGTVVEFVVFWLSAATGIMINAIITRRMNCARVFFTVKSPL